ncbi:hypothetical protein ACFC6L_29960 [Kitasatospora phosalacinea]|uniref:hypothetical protein n=1 Tax=Kitasatospora phosalacinea TaxID=2065 RepID=UPI0035E03316
MSVSGNRLPVEFLTAVAAGAEPGSAAALMVAEQARERSGDRQTGELLEALLRGPFRESAPDWMLTAAVAEGMRADDSDYRARTTVELAALALGHPDFDGGLLADALRDCSAYRLGLLGTADRPPALTAAVADELHRQVPQRPPFTSAMLKDRTPAQEVFRAGRLDDRVFDAAVALLPGAPDRSRPEGESREEWSERIRAEYRAWESMWRTVLEQQLEQQLDRHSRFVRAVEGTEADSVVRRQLLGGLPWMVEPGLLRRLALDDLASFDSAVLTARICGMVAEGASEDEARDRFSVELAALDGTARKELSLYLGDDPVLGAEFGREAAVLWAQSAADEHWRLILDPTEAKPRYSDDPYPWRTPPEELADLASRFALVAEQALHTWQPREHYGISQAADLRWVHAMLVHLPEVTAETRAAVQRIVRDARRNPNRPRSYRPQDYEDHEQFTKLLTDITRIVANPLPQSSATRRAALGDPVEVTSRQLSAVEPALLTAYLDQHAGNDQLVEKALLSCAQRGSHGSEPVFADILARHSDPQHALRTLTRDLRRRLGGGPNDRESWTRHVLALPDHDQETVLALPAWTTLTVGGPRYRGSIHPAVLTLVTTTLGDDPLAWQRFADSPISHAGHTAWLRLGEVLDAAVRGTPWPKPPTSR